MTANRWRALVGSCALAAVIAFFALGWHRHLTFTELKAQQVGLASLVAERPLESALSFLAVYVGVTALSLPGAAIMTLAGGAIFGFAQGGLLVSIASTIGATLACAGSRFVLRDWVQAKFRDRLKSVFEGFDREGAFYLFTLRLLPAVPFFVTNLAMGLTRVPLRTFALVSWIGMLPGSLVYVNAGTQLARLDSPSEILSLPLLASFVLLSVFPWIARAGLGWNRTRKLSARFEKPSRFEFDAVVIGAGSAGLVSSLIAATLKAKVALVEKHKMGGDCLNTGCVPSKALIRTAKLVKDAATADRLGLKRTSIEVDFASVMERVQEVIRKIEPHDSVERYTSLGVQCFAGQAKIESPWCVRVGERKLLTRNIIVATGARPVVPTLPGLDAISWYTSDTIWNLRRAPKRLVVLGGGPIGCELSQAFHRLGVPVTQVERGSRLMAREDEDVSLFVQSRFAAEGVDVRLGHEALRIEVDGDKRFLLCKTMGKTIGESEGETRIECDALLFALGRRANLEGFGLEELGVRINDRGTLDTNERLQTNFPNVYACGDVVGPYQFTHMASHQAWYASVNALLRPFWSYKADMRVVPWATYVDPEVARVGWNEQDATAAGVAHLVSRYDLGGLDRAVCDGENAGFVKFLTKPGSDRILGATVVGPRAGDWMAEIVLAMKHGVGLNKILGTIHVYPTLSEANKFAAGVWKRQTAPTHLLKWVEKFHALRRG